MNLTYSAYLLAAVLEAIADHDKEIYPSTIKLAAQALIDFAESKAGLDAGTPKQVYQEFLDFVK